MCRTVATMATLRRPSLGSVLLVWTVAAATACLGTLAAGAHPGDPGSSATKGATGTGRPLVTAVLDSIVRRSESRVAPTISVERERVPSES